jgi:hypothetical protein
MLSGVDRVDITLCVTNFDNTYVITLRLSYFYIRVGHGRSKTKDSSFLTRKKE